MINVRSLAFKSAIIYLAIFLSGLSVVGILLLKNSSQNILESAQKNISHRADLIVIKIDEYLNSLKSDITYVASSPVLHNYLEQPNEENYTLLSKEFLALIRSKPDISQIRFISKAEYGKEKVRVDMKNDIPEIIPNHRLQNKGDRPYYKEAVELPEQEIYFSSIDLNKELGKLSIPYTPTLRVAKSIYLNGENHGVVVINTNLSPFFNNLENTVEKDYVLRMVNPDGYYIMHEDKDSTFLFDFLDSPPVQFNPTVLNSNDATLRESGDELMALRVINYPKKAYDLLFYVMADKRQVLGVYYQWRKKSTLIIILTGLLFLMASFFVMNRQMTALTQITKRLREFPAKRLVSNLPMERNDEIGDLAKSLYEMANIINQQIESIEKSRHKAEEAEKVKTEFIENMSHEIRNPLQSIMGLCSMLENNNPSSNQITILNSLKLNTNNLHALVNNVLDYQNLLKGDVELNPIWISYTQFIDGVVIGNKFGCVEKGLQLNSQTDQRLAHKELRFDEMRLGQIMNNLLSNSIKFTSAGGKISVETNVLDQDQSNVTIEIKISDTGIGMSKDELKYVRNRYYTKTGESRNRSNFGLGLTIVQELLAQMNSELTVASVKGKGSTFSFSLTVPYKTLASDPKPTKVSNTLEHYTMLVIEDDDQIISLYQYIFDDPNMDVQYVNKLDDDFQPLTNFDIVISDYRLSNDTLDNRLALLDQLIQEDTFLLVASATIPDLAPFENRYNHVVFVRKPFSIEQLKSTLLNGVIFSRYGLPHLEEIKKDYDYNQDKFRHALNLLISEWTLAKEKLIHCIENQDLDLYREIIHKLITMVRRLKLTKFESWLSRIDEQFENGELDLSRTSKEMDNIMTVYLRTFQEDVS